MDQNENSIKTQKSSEDEDLGESYFGGLLRFKTKIVWPNAIGFLVIHIAGFYGFYLAFGQMWNLHFLTPVYGYFVSFLGGEGVTGGAHRLWSHKSYKARRPLRILLMIMQTFAGQNCIFIWVRDHRLHHKYTDTNADPHNATRGFFFSHMGWLMMKKHPDVIKKGKCIDMSDIERDEVVMFQKRHFKKIFYSIGSTIPVLIPVYFWGEDFWTSVYICFFARYILLLHIAWSVNSAAHMFGMRPYDRNILPSENSFVSFVAYGEGWHNYHHAFPWDYKASEFGMKLNFTRDMIQFFERIGLAYDLKEAKQEMVVRKILRSGDGSHEKHIAYKADQLAKISHPEAPPDQKALGY